MKRVRNPDAVCMHLLESFLHRAKASGVTVLLCGVRDDLHDAMRRAGVELPAGTVFREQTVRNTSTLMAVRRAFELVGHEESEAPSPVPAAPRADLYFMI